MFQVSASASVKFSNEFPMIIFHIILCRHVTDVSTASKIEEYSLTCEEMAAG